MEISEKFDRHIASKLPPFGRHSCWCKSRPRCDGPPFLFDRCLMSVLLCGPLSQFIFSSSLRIDGTQGQMLSKFGRDLTVTFGANHLSLVGTTAGVKAEVFALPFMYSLNVFLSELLPQVIFKFSPHIDRTQRRTLRKTSLNYRLE